MPHGKFIVALDGPAGAGKSTVSRLTASRLGFTLVDTGAIYRSVALLATRRGVAHTDDLALGPLVATARVRFELRGERNHVFLDQDDVTDAIRTPENSLAASTVSARPVVRDGLLSLQRRLALETADPGAVLEGRDIGTVVFPDAEVKVFLTASVDERARRRHQELLAKGDAPPLTRIHDEIVQRDAQDSGRAAAPLKQALDAVPVDTTGLTLQQVVEKIVALVERRRGA
jgi:cytidylate kinase